MNIRHIHTYRSGFTLVELAIVITIIGILIGGVLKGQQLIDQARLAGTIQQMNAYKTAVMIFQTKYDDLPGDMPNPDDRIVGCSGCVATVFPRGGNVNDSDIGQNNDARWTHQQNVLGAEPTMFWLHLYKANLISGVSDAALSGGPVEWGTTHPAAKSGGGFSVGDSNGEETDDWSGNMGPYGTVLLLHKGFDDSGLNTGGGSNVISAAQAAGIDRKLDDGQPDTGDLRALGRPGVCWSDEDAPAAEYLESTSGNQICALSYTIAE